MRIGEVSRRTGVPVPTLRSWERRYDLLDPARTPGGHRIYAEADVERVLAIRGLTDQGYAVSDAIVMVREGRARLAVADGPEAAEFGRVLWAAIDAFDAAQVARTMDDALAHLGVPAFIDDVAVPLLQQLGVGWRSSDRAIAREHLGTHLLRGRMMDELRRPTIRESGRALACTPEDEWHDVGTLMAAVILAGEGWDVRFLGAHTPRSALAAAVRDVTPEVVLVGAVMEPPAHRFTRNLRLGEGARVLLGGPGFATAQLPRSGVVLRHHGPYREVPARLRELRAARP